MAQQTRADYFQDGSDDPSEEAHFFRQNNCTWQSA
jgi:hypothetical protein